MKNALSPHQVAAAYQAKHDSKGNRVRADYVGGGWIRVSIIGAAAPGGCTTTYRASELRSRLGLTLNAA